MKEKMVNLSLHLAPEPMRLILAEAKRTGKTMNEVVVDLIGRLPPAPATEFVFDPDDPLWESRLIDELAIKHLKVN
jgi:hypothetical protein